LCDYAAMKVLVLGAGVVGLSTAYALAKDGHRVSILDRHEGVARGASFANGGQLSYSYVAPLASLGTLLKLPQLLAGGDSPMRFDPGRDLEQWQWALSFVRACLSFKGRLTTQRLLALSFASRAQLHDLMAAEKMEFKFTQRGKLIVYSDRASLRNAARVRRFQQTFGCQQELLDREECVQLEPTLEHIRSRICGGLYSPGDESGDCHLFCTELARILTSAKYGVQLLLDTTLLTLRTRGRRIAAAVTNKGELEADAYVLALGVEGKRLTRPLGFDLPITALKGYSLTVPGAGPGAPKISITDLRHRLVYAPLGEHLRIAGIADLDGSDERAHPERLQLIKRQAQATFPDGLDYAHSLEWVGSRPATPSGLPVLGRSPVADNLFLNVGHGALGFTLALGSGRVIADRIGDKPIPAPLADLVG
jgi:D-amino-acid dehydrogenase